MEKHSAIYDAYYYAHSCGKQPYERNQGWLDSFAKIAERIIRDIQPVSVLDAGCALGFLVEGFRNRDIDAFGIDISNYAINNVDDSIKPYCWQGSIGKPFPQRYDLIISIEVLEHLTKVEAEKAIANLCQHTDDILFSSSPFDYKEATHFNVQPPEYWASVFARHGFFRDVDYDVSFITPWAVRFRKTKEPIERVIVSYERKHWLLLQDNNARRKLDIELRNELSAKEHEIRNKFVDLQTRVEKAEGELQAIINSNGWRMLQKTLRFRERIIPLGSRREDAMHAFLRAIRVFRNEGLRGIYQRVASRTAWRMKVVFLGARYRLKGSNKTRILEVPGVVPAPDIMSHEDDVDIIVCVHNALDDVQRCLESIIRSTSKPYRLIIVDDGSHSSTREFLERFADQYQCTLLRNEQASGYTRAANRGLRVAEGEFVVLLNSDTVVTPQWLDRMITCAESDDRIGLVGPLSNTASWQSIPDFESEGDWADNKLPDNVSIDEMGELVFKSSARLYPEMAFLNGFCLMIRKRVIEQIGGFDEENFGEGYGEENDYCIRAQKADLKLALADDTYIYHAQSRSYNHDKRKKLSRRAAEVLAQKYGQMIMDQGVRHLREDRVFEGMRARARQIFPRKSLVEQGLSKYAGHKVLFVLPIVNAGGGGNIVMKEARAIKEMGVEVNIFNLRAHRSAFEDAYPGLDLQVIYGEIDDIPNVAARYDAVVATFNPSVAWIAPAVEIKRDLIVGYYAQDFEPMFYPPDSDGFQQAWDSYTLIPNCVRFAKTEWTQQKIENEIGAQCHLVGPSMDVDLFVPRPRESEWPDRPLRIGAMIRPGSRYRAPQLTMEVFERLNPRYGPRVEFWLFGSELNDPDFAKLSQDFPWKLAGIIGPRQVANFLNELDIFVDFSSHQAMGLTAMEAMACGVAVIVPREGGTATFSHHEQNCLMVDTTDQEECIQALSRLVDDHNLRKVIQNQALRDIPQYFPEGPALRILGLLFGE